MDFISSKMGLLYIFSYCFDLVASSDFLSQFHVFPFSGNEN